MWDRTIIIALLVFTIVFLIQFIIMGNISGSILYRGIKDNLKLWEFRSHHRHDLRCHVDEMLITLSPR